MRLALNGWFNNPSPNRRWLIELIPLAILIAATWALFYPSLRYGFIWDDPIWLKVSVRGAPWQMLTAAQTWEDYRYYRPIGLGLFRFFVRADGTFDSGAMHAVQVAVHSLAGVLVYGFARQLRLRPFVALLAASLFILYPHNHQAVVRVLQGEPLCAVFVLIAAILYLRARSPDSPLTRTAFVISTVAYLAALFTLESAVPFAALFPALELWAWQRGLVKRFGRVWTVHGVLALMFVFFWRVLPPTNISGVRHIGFYPQTLSILLQAAAYPLGLMLSAFNLLPPEAALGVAFALVITAVVVVLWRRGRGTEAFVCVVWFALGACLVMLLDAEYVRIGSRLMYLGSIGAALGWAAFVEGIARGRRVGRPLAALFVIGLLWMCLRANRTLTRLYDSGNNHLRAMIATLSPSEEQLVFVNYPDRFALKEPLLPLGYWGVTLAEGALNLADYAEVAAGPRSPALSLAVPQIGAGDREAWPYAVDMRGNVFDAAGLYAALRGTDRVYRSDYLAGGGLALVSVGSIQVGAVSVEPIAVLGDKLALVSAHIDAANSDYLNLTLVWRVNAPPEPDDTIFVHVLDESSQVVAGVDGDSLGDLVPLSAWRPGDTLTDERRVPLPAGLPPGDYVVTAGVYDRASGERMIAINARGEPVWENEIQVGRVSLP